MPRIILLQVTLNFTPAPEYRGHGILVYTGIQ